MGQDIVERLLDLDYMMTNAVCPDLRKEAADEIERLRAALETARQAFAEIRHARTRPDWFTRGEDGAWAHSSLWEQRGMAAVNAALAAKEQT